jgi:hypothetical protein
MLALDVVAMAHALRDELGVSLRSLRSMLTEEDVQSEGLSVEQQQDQQETDTESEQQRVRAYLGAVRVDTLTRIEREFAFFAQQLRALGSQGTLTFHFHRFCFSVLKSTLFFSASRSWQGDGGRGASAGQADRSRRRR